MAYFDNDDLYPVNRITTGTVGGPGRRVFILQAQVEGHIVSWVIEKQQAVALSRLIPKLLNEVLDEYPELGEPLVASRPNLSLREPLEPVFRVGSITIDYDRLHDLVVLTLADADEGVDENAELDEESVDEPIGDIQIFTTRGQALLLSKQAEEVISGGRPACPDCGEPIDDFGHFCLPPIARRKLDDNYVQ